MSLAERIQSRSGGIHRQQVEVLQQYIQELEKENRSYRARLQEESERMEQVRTHLSEDWYFVKRELYNFIQLTRAMTAAQATESPLLKNIVQFDRRVESLLAPGGPVEIQEVNPTRARTPEQKRSPLSTGESPPADVDEDELREILGLW